MTAVGRDPRTSRGGTAALRRFGRPLAVAAVLAAVAVTVLLLARGGAPPLPAPPGAGRSTLELAASASGTQRCMVPTAAALRGAEVAFAGEVTEVDGRQVSLDPDRFYVGVPVDSVVVAQASGSVRDLVGAVRFEEGGRYLVAASGGRVMVCGFSGVQAPALSRLYARAFLDRAE